MPNEENGVSKKKRRKSSVESSSSSDSYTHAKKRKQKKEKKKRKKEKKRRKKAKFEEEGTPSLGIARASASSVQKKEIMRSGDEETKEAVHIQNKDVDSDSDIGPEPLPSTSTHVIPGTVDYGASMLRGEGAAIAQFVQKNMRVPRRGEVGWQGEEIERLESVGYVMSGSRHARMNAVRVRKENQVYSAEEKRALVLANIEEKQKKEAQVVNEFRTMLEQKLAAVESERLERKEK